jgi:hypothetical protein
MRYLVQILSIISLMIATECTPRKKAGTESTTSAYRANVSCTAAGIATSNHSRAIICLAPTSISATPGVSGQATWQPGAMYVLSR